MALPASPVAVADLEKQLFGVWKIEPLYAVTKAGERRRAMALSRTATAF